jgi:hypothetical protein
MIHVLFLSYLPELCLLEELDELDELEELAELGLGLLLFRAAGGAFLPELEGELELKDGRG